MVDLLKEISGTTYPGRGIVVGKSADGKYAVIAYFIMGRSENSRNRIFVREGDGNLKTEAFDPSKLVDPSLIIYRPVRTIYPAFVVTNGVQTEDVADALIENISFEQSLRGHTFEPDGPNFTPRISAALRLGEKGGFGYKMSIVKSNEGREESVLRFFYEYPQPVAGQGHYIHTYKGDGNPLPSFEGEPTPVTIEGDLDTFTGNIWNALNEDNKVSLFTRFIDLADGSYEDRIVNKNK